MRGGGEPPDALYEFVNLQSLPDLAADAPNEEGEWATKYLNRPRDSGSPIEGEMLTTEDPESFANVMISYCRPHGLPGRMYELGPIVQNISRSAREATLFGSSAHDCDIRAPRPSITNKMAGDCPTLGDIPATRRYVDDPVARRRFVSNALEVTTDRANGIVNLIFYGGGPFRGGREAELPELYLISQEVRMAADGILSLPRFAYLAGRGAYAGEPPSFL